MPVTTAHLAQLKKSTTPELRQLASKQLGQAEQALEAGKKSTDDISWWQQPLQVSHYARWKPFADAVAESERVFQLGDVERDESTKRARYTEAYRTAFATAEDIAKEAKLPPTNFTTVWQSEVSEPLQQAIDELGKKVRGPLDDLGNTAVVVAVLWGLYRLVKK